MVPKADICFLSVLEEAASPGSRSLEGVVFLDDRSSSIIQWL